MATVHSVSGGFTDAPGKIMSFETGKLAGQADGAVVARLGDTVVLVTATAAKHVRENADFFPLTVDIEERMYAAGKIPGSFFRREGRAPEAAILNCRLIDRALRPLFPDGFRNEIHVVGTVFGADQVNPYDVLAINGASAALMISGIPFGGPIGAVRIAWTREGTWLAHPTYQEGDEACFEMVVAGAYTADGSDIAVMMVEAGGTEKSFTYYDEGAPRVDEAALARGLDESKVWIREAIEIQRRLIDAVGDRTPLAYELQVDYSDAIWDAVVAAGTARITETQKIVDKSARLAAESEARQAILDELLPKFADSEPAAEKYIKSAVRSLTKKIVRSRIVKEGQRIDGRGVRDLRAISAEVGLIPTAHGTGLFNRGETQVLNFCTLGMQRLDQMIDGIDPITRKRFMHHYNMAPFSTGEAGFMRGPKRREIGHGALAERAVYPVVPSFESFPYTIRLVSEALSSNGSTSMASVCSSSLSLMDAGVPIKAPVAGIAMGLVFAEGEYTALTDILGAEDAFGDMDFKVAGTADAITALQLDTKIDGIPADVLSAALAQARDARLAILDIMMAAIAAPRSDVGANAPKIVSFEIPADKIGEVIGPKGKVINQIQADTGADIAVDDKDGVGIVSIGSPNRDAVYAAEQAIRLIISPPRAEIGEVYKGRVVNITKFGAFVNILPGRDGLVHISKLGGGRRVDRVEDVVSLGDEIEVVVEDIDGNNKISLTPVGMAAPSTNGDGGAAAPDATRTDESGIDYVSFEDIFDNELRAEHGDLGPAGGRGPSTGGGGAGRDRGGRSGGGGGRDRGGRGGGGGSRDRGGRR
jgi:polyribonucleotide nucleotidyltransferase